ncbi:MAG: CaiB/BaiF CoA-transferase family protein [Alphaproteobacteria bacterium]|nr:CaiB/BaiF CoA-transferase family protein [Alphaproteobacteria bacterium]
MLEGVKVVELATYMAAPSAAMVLSDWGADVIKIEELGGDPVRGAFRGISRNKLVGNPMFAFDNRGKRGVAINIRDAAGAKIVREMIAAADIFITNVRPAALKRAGLDYEAISAENPRLIYSSVTGYGLQGEETNRPGFDIVAFWARSGLARMIAPKGADPIPIRAAVGDHITGITTVSGILAALYARDRTGKGTLVETSLLRTGIFALASDMATQMHFGKLSSTPPRERADEATRNFYKTSDGEWLMLIPRGNKTDFSGICKVVGHPELLDDPRFKTPIDRKENAAAMVKIFDDALAKRTLAEWGKIFDDADLVWAPVLHPNQVVVDPQAHASGSFIDVPDGAGGTVKGIASPVRFNGEPIIPKRPMPEPGQHTTEVLGELGYEPAAIEKLRAGGVIN